MFSDDGAASYPCKGELFRGITHVEEEAAKRKFYAIEKLELIYIGIKPIY
jgi:hypothetical protein